MKDTCNGFDKDGSGQMQFPEYKEAWTFLAQLGGEAEMKRAFDSVDVDGSGNVDWNEFCFSIMGAAASKVTSLNDYSSSGVFLS